MNANGEFSAALQVDAATAESIDQVGEFTVPVTVTSSNYVDATINVVMAPTARTEKTVTISGVPDSENTTFGDSSFTLTATVDDAGAKPEDWYWYSSDPSVLEVDAVNGSHQMQVHVKGAGSAQIMAWYEPSSGSTIGAAVTDFIAVNKANINPSDAPLTAGPTARSPIRPL